MFAFRLMKNGGLINKTTRGSGIDINILDHRFSHLHHLTFEYNIYFSAKYINHMSMAIKPGMVYVENDAYFEISLILIDINDYVFSLKKVNENDI